MTCILNIETATKNCSVSLAKDGKTIGIKEIATEQFSHAEKLHVFIEELLKETQLTFKDLDAVAISKGPGSYTGLRIGVSTAKGLCYALDLPLISVDTLEILANALTVTSGVIVPMIDARRMEVFSAVFNTGKRKIRDTQAEIIDVDSYREISEDIHLIGDGAQKLQETLTASKFIYHPEIVYPSTQEMSFLSFEKYKISDFEDVAYFEPYYLKDFVLNK
ncbi:tRNA (adenosine(37)-N6)-threonylcarbamoyltransferase complex dimerization subunit type 1 TsaB [Flavobacterium sp. NRK F10]|uniref:tRNA (adenosine(37)-N6)-threonylcarbamoyltransferase complex dimerization subunit type 1 TsaB n=1 Tax=Flavobacterium sp. NRK F10 TaxID=2954931 RepID=UPI002090B0A5|nr:tRNA (adenosine(37)-N6)-threonylcarbamoyltransferase complex dimerization subunit type 1 TsaB [Flavobacterium sp. NRK F10]MCO6175171.1 tRNA (adenosine(37)-N6)-threonylcarbamoyltransferase complex dimerization subunit type 1 TsaB [Flavobacterium sp. NRK F10]